MCLLLHFLDPDVEHIIANAPDANDYPDADTLVLFNHFSHDVLPTGQSRYTTHQVVKILTERASKNMGILPFLINLTLKI